MNKILETLSKEELKKLKIVELEKGETIFFEFEKCNYVGLVKRGEIKIISYLEDGKEIVYSVIGPDGMFGNNLIFSNDPRYRGDVIASKKSVLYLISKEQLVELLKNNERFLMTYLVRQSETGKSLNIRIKLLTFNSAEERLLYFLQINNSKLKYKSISDLAMTLNLSREVLSRLIHRLEKENVIYIKDKTIVKC